MSIVEIQKQVKFINDVSGKRTGVIVPLKLFQELIELKIGMEIYEDEDVQRSLKRAKKQVEEGTSKSFKNAGEALRWLKQ